MPLLKWSIISSQTTHDKTSNSSWLVFVLQWYDVHVKTDPNKVQEWAKMLVTKALTIFVICFRLVYFFSLVYFFRPVYFFAKKTQNFGLFQSLSAIYALLVESFTGLNSMVVYKRDIYQEWLERIFSIYPNKQRQQQVPTSVEKKHFSKANPGGQHQHVDLAYLILHLCQSPRWSRSKIN